MEKYNKFLRDIAELIEKSLFRSKDLKNYVEDSIKSKTEVIVNKLNLVSREEFEIQKKMIEKLKNNLNQFKSDRQKVKSKKKTIKAKKF